MKSILINLSVLMISAFSVGMQAQDKGPVRMGGGGFTVGYGHLPVSELESFVPAGFSFDNDHLMLGGAGYSMIDRFVIGGSGSSVVGDEINNDSLKMSLSGGYGTFDFGYLIVNKKRFKLFPMIGIGGGGYSLSISKRGNVSRSELIDEPEREIDISDGGFMMDFSVNVNFMPTYYEKDNAGGGMMTGLELGYLYNFPSSDWSYDGGDITNGPDFGLQGFYVKLIVGGFGMGQ